SAARATSQLTRTGRTSADVHYDHPDLLPSITAAETTVLRAKEIRSHRVAIRDLRLAARAAGHRRSAGTSRFQHDRSRPARRCGCLPAVAHRIPPGDRTASTATTPRRP